MKFATSVFTFLIIAGTVFAVLFAIYGKPVEVTDTFSNDKDDTASAEKFRIYWFGVAAFSLMAASGLVMLLAYLLLNHDFVNQLYEKGRELKASFDAKLKSYQIVAQDALSQVNSIPVEQESSSFFSPKKKIPTTETSAVEMVSK